jgi:hypothetical protein
MQQCSYFVDSQYFSIALNDGELERIWEEVVMVHFEALSWHLFGKTEGDTESLSQESQCHSQN